MTKWGEKISDISLEELQRNLVETDDDGKAVKRLVAAIAYKHGQSPADIEERFGLSRNNVYAWLDRFEERGLDEALYDEPKPGRPPKLSDEEFDEFVAVVNESPEDAGYGNVEAWTPKLVQHWLKSRFDVEYTRRHIRRLMDETGLSWRTARPEHHDIDPGDVTELRQTAHSNESP